MSIVAIHSVDGLDSLSLERNDYDEFVNYELTASFSGETVTNEEVVFSNVPAFLDALDSFDSTRTGTVVLGGTEDCELSIEPDGATGDMWLSFQVARTLSTFSPKTGRHRRSGRVLLAGAFSVSGEKVGQLVADFRRLFHRECGAP